jgi:ankyrin repeat protein
MQTWGTSDDPNGVGTRQVVVMLLERGCDVNVPGSGGWTAMQAATAMGDREQLVFLLDSGADPMAAVESRAGIAGLSSCDLAMMRLQANSESRWSQERAAILADTGRCPNLEFQPPSGG